MSLPTTPSPPLPVSPQAAAPAPASDVSASARTRTVSVSSADEQPSAAPAAQPTPSAAAAPSPALAASQPGPSPKQRSSPGPSSSPTAPSLTPAYRRQLQSIRSSDLEAEHKLWVAQWTSESDFWTKMEARYEMLLKRAQVGAASSRDLHLYMKRSSRLLAGLSEQIQGLGTFGAHETGTMRVACMSIDIVRKTTSSYLGELNARVFGESVRAAGVAAEEATKLASRIEELGADMLGKLRERRRATHDAWQAYYKGGQERTRAEQQGGKIKTDPYLLIRAYEHELALLQTTESRFQTLMASLLRELQTEDAKRLTAMKAVLVDNLVAQQAVLEQSSKFTVNALQTVRAIDPEKDMAEFVQAADLMLAPNVAAAASPSSPNPDAAAAAAALASPPGGAAAAPGVENVLAAHASTEKATSALASQTPTIAFLQPPPARDAAAMPRVFAHEVEKEGALARQGAVIKSNWKPAVAVVTSSGFLHLYDPESAPTPGGKAAVSAKRSVHSSFNLAECTIETGEAAHPLAFALKFPHRGFSFSNSPQVVYFKADNSDELSEWIFVCQKYQMQPATQQQPTLVQQAQQQHQQQQQQAEASSAAAAAAAGSSQ